MCDIPVRLVNRIATKAKRGGGITGNPALLIFMPHLQITNVRLTFAT